MRRYQNFIVIFIISLLLVGNFTYKLNASINSKELTNEAVKQQLIQIKPDITSFDSKQAKIQNFGSQTKSLLINTTINKKLNKIILILYKNILYIIVTIFSVISLLNNLDQFFKILPTTLQTYLKTRLIFWRFTPLVWDDIKKYQEIFKKTIYDNSVLNEKEIRQEIDKDLRTCLTVKEIYSNSHKNEQIYFKDIARVFIEKKLIEPKVFNRDSFLANLKKYLSDPKQLKEYLNTIQIQNVFIIVNQAEEIKKYLDEICKDQEDKGSDFYSDIKIGSGFIAPLYLIAGPLRHFEENWPKIISKYKRSFAGISRELHQFQQFKLSNFTTWIAWGPSIPICTCNKWTYDIEDSRDALITFQCGFGDENNSVPLIVSEKRQGEYENYLKHNPSSIIIKEGDLTVKPTLLSKQTRTRLAKAQKDLINPQQDKFVLKIPNDKETSTLRELSGEDYYSAYFWMLFGIKQNSTLFNDEDIMNKIDQKNASSIYQNILPFFEHINIASPHVYESYKKVFARKILEFIKSNSDPSRSFVYLCAFDDCNCKGNHKLIGHFPGKRIKDILRDFIQTDKDYESLRKSISFESQNFLPACDLPSLIDHFNKNIS